MPAELPPDAVHTGDSPEFTEATMPDAWQALLDESAHEGFTSLPEKGAPIIIIGCAVTIIGGIGLIAARLNDVDAEFQRCDSGYYCQGPVNWSCCSVLKDIDRNNCYISLGQNGPDNDYATCCH